MCGDDWCTRCQVDRLLEALEIWRSEADELREHREQCELAGKEVREEGRESSGLLIPILFLN